MGFPYTYEGKIDVIGDRINKKPLNKETLSEALRAFAETKPPSSENQVSPHELSYAENNTFLKISYDITLETEQNDTDWFVLYKIDTDKLLKITLAAVVLLAFVSFYSVTGYLISAFIFVLAFFSVNLFFITSNLIKEINRVVGNTTYNFAGSEHFGPEQQKWLSDPGLCPACGADIQAYDMHCPECGLRLLQNNYSRPLDTSKYNDASVRYEYKSKKK